MSHTRGEKRKLLSRVRRIRGQVEAIERALDTEAGCDTVMHLIAGVRGATSGLMVEVIKDHIRDHLVHAGPKGRAAGSDAAEQLIDVVRAYLK